MLVFVAGDPHTSYIWDHFAWPAVESLYFGLYSTRGKF